MLKFAIGDTVRLKKDIPEKRLFLMLRIRETFGDNPLKVVATSNENNESSYLVTNYYHVTNYVTDSWVKEEWLELCNEAKISVTPDDLMAIL